MRDSRASRKNSDVAIIVVGGHASKVGKTFVVEQIIRAFPQLHWTAFKVTPHPHGQTDVPFSIVQEHDATAATDTSRFLAAGAVRSFLICTNNGNLEASLPQLRDELTRSTNAIIESNSILDFWQPDLSFIVLDRTIKDFKYSASRFLECADAVLWTSNSAHAPEPIGWPPHAATLAQKKFQFVLDEDYGISCELSRWITGRLGPPHPQL